MPVLVVQGDRDPFGMPPAGPGREVVALPGADHSLERGRDELARAVTGFVGAIVTSGRS